jgi:hypothetical protein
MRVLGMALAGVLALIAPIAAHSASPGSNTGQTATGPPPGIAQVGDGHNSDWHPAHSGPSRFNGGWVPYGGTGVPTYWVWGPSGGAFDYPFSDWRGPTGGWGNP